MSICTNCKGKGKVISRSSHDHTNTWSSKCTQCKGTGKHSVKYFVVQKGCTVRRSGVYKSEQLANKDLPNVVARLKETYKNLSNTTEADFEVISN